MKEALTYRRLKDCRHKETILLCIDPAVPDGVFAAIYSESLVWKEAKHPDQLYVFLCGEELPYAVQDLEEAKHFVEDRYALYRQRLEDDLAAAEERGRRTGPEDESEDITG